MKDESAKRKIPGTRPDLARKRMTDGAPASVVNIFSDYDRTMVAETAGFRFQGAGKTGPARAAALAAEPAAGIWEIAPTHFGIGLAGVFFRFCRSGFFLLSILLAAILAAVLLVMTGLLLLYFLDMPIDMPSLGNFFSSITSGLTDWMLDRVALPILILALIALLVLVTAASIMGWYYSSRELAKRNIGENGFRIRIDLDKNGFYAWVNWDGWAPKAHKEGPINTNPDYALLKLLPLLYLLQEYTKGYARLQHADMSSSKEKSVIRFKRPLLKDLLFAAPCLIMAVAGVLCIVAATGGTDLLAPILPFGLAGMENIPSFPAFKWALIVPGVLAVLGGTLGFLIVFFRRWLSNRLKVTITEDGEEAALVEWVNWRRFIPYTEWILYDDTGCVKDILERLLQMQKHTGLPFQFRPLQS